MWHVWSLFPNQGSNPHPELEEGVSPTGLQSPIYCIYWLSVWYTKYTQFLWYLTVCFLWMKKMDSLRMNSHERVRSYTSSEPHFHGEPQVRLELANSSSKYIRLWSINCFPYYQTRRVYICEINWHLKNTEQGREEPFLKFIYLFIFTVERYFFSPLVPFINSAILNLLVYAVCVYTSSLTGMYSFPHTFFREYF